MLEPKWHKAVWVMTIKKKRTTATISGCRLYYSSRYANSTFLNYFECSFKFKFEQIVWWICNWFVVRRVVSSTCRITFGKISKMAKLVWSHKVSVVCLHCRQKNEPANRSDSWITFWKVCAHTTATHSATSRAKFWIWSMSLPTFCSLT